MSAGAPWSVKGIDPKAREVAKDLARRSGLTLGEWLNRIILEDELPDEITHESQFAERPLRAVGAAPHLRTVALAAAPPDLARVAGALDRLTDRIEASETRTGLAINGVEHSVRHALARIETAEREQHAQTARLEGLLAESSTQHGYFGERLRRLEAEPRPSGDVGPRSAEALRAIEARLARAEPELVVEAVLQRLGDRLALAESRTAAALDDLKGSLAGLDRRVAAVEGGASAGEPVELRFEALAEVLTHQVEAVRAEVAGKLAAAGGGLEARFAELTEQVRVAEQRSAQAVEAIGRQVLSMAEAVGRKLTEVDEKSAGAIDQVGTEVARIAGAVELRLARQEQTQAEAFERLEAELAKVTGTLARRLDTSEQRAGADPAAWTAAAERVAPEPTLAEIIQKLGPPPEPEPERLDLAEPAPAALGPELLSRAEPEPGHEPAHDIVEPPWRRLDLDVPEPEIPEVFAPLAEGEDEALFEPGPAEPELSTREVIERARAAARAAATPDPHTPQEPPLQVRAKVGPKAATGRLFQGFGPKTRKPAPNTALQTAMMIAGGAAFLSVGAAGLTLMQGPASPDPAAAPGQAPIPDNPRAAMALSPAHLPTRPQDTTVPAAPAAFADVRADVEAGVPGALAQLTALAEVGHAQAQLYLAQLYDTGAAGLPENPTEARRWTALAAENGDVKAMHNLAVYEFRGEGGPQDLVSAARWFRKAADAGVVESQYNLGLLYQSGSGVDRNLAAARQWFARAAARGDAEARKALAPLAPRPAPAQPRAPAAATPKPAPAAASPALAAGVSMNVQQTQMVLTRLGYYTGPIDGRASTAYHRALADYRRDQDGGVPLYSAER
ncbi:MAG: SEL1-like repeat protein [Phenylobacterium sp.]|uniref:SEL1-like repeat protein n=1 Tax=Phenylobacterium sp. TaxID=1871053 RepID=UPI001A498E44|nr:hypothetical protein [Phenylobacterium sp.]MBL8555340.1 SEL1-like repeat protein [Phenylobacterium sp.]